MRAVERLDEQTRVLQTEMDAEIAALLEVETVADYQRYLSRLYGFLAPLERSLSDTPGLGPYVDVRGLQKHTLIEHDLERLGLKQLEIQSIPQCMWIPWFDDFRTALGWAYVIERNTLAHPNLFRHLANVLPGEAAFAATFLKVYSGSTAEMWQSFTRGLDLAVTEPAHLDTIVTGALAGFRFFRRWRNTVNGGQVSGMHEIGPTDEVTAREPDRAQPSSRPASEES